MRGDDDRPDFLFSYVSPERRVPADHPLRAIRALTDRVLARMSARFTRLYAEGGRPSIPPEQLLRALLLQVLYTVRSERLLIEQLDYNLLFRWFVGLSLDEPIWHHSTFSKNRDRLLAGDIAQAFFVEIRTEAHAHGLLSAEHFTVDGTLLEAWASQKSVQPVAGAPSDRDDDRGNPTVNFHGTPRTNATHRSTTDPDARLARKGGSGARLAYGAHLLVEHRSGLVVDTLLTSAGDGRAEVDAALVMAQRIPGRHRVTLAGDKGYDERRLVAELRRMRVTPHVAQYRPTPRRHSAIDRRTTRHVGYALSQRRRKRVEEVFGWMKTIGLLRKLRHRGGPRVAWIWTFTAAAYNLVRIPRMLAARA